MSRLPELPSFPHSPWQWLYGAAHRARARWYQGRAVRLPRPVVSLGNLHWGGTGKTPLVAALAQRLRDQGRRVAILSRGYGSRGSGIRLVSGWTGGPRLGPNEAGDEPLLLADQLPGVAVVVHAARAAAGLWALRHLEPPPDLFLLDDGFSHLGLTRDVDLLALPASDPFGGGRLFPSGRLREPLAAASRAHAALLTGLEVSSSAARAIEQELRPCGFSGRVFTAPTRILPARRLDGKPLPIGCRVVLACGIARPERFQAAVRQQGFEIAAELVFDDHHTFPPSSRKSMANAFATSHSEAVLVTSKDAVKLRDFPAAPIAELPIAAEPEPEFWPWLSRRLSAQAGAAQ